MSAVSHVVHDLWRCYQQPLNLVFGKQKHFGRARMQECVDLYDFKDGRGRIKGATVGDPIDLPPLQASDIRAYEMGKEQRGERRRRYPFQALVDGCKERGIPLTMKFASITRISDRATFEKRDG
jgi:hypothetical protein